MAKRIVVYYSLTENTKEAAEKIADRLSADIVRIKTVKDIPETDAKKFLIGGMQAMFGMKPEIEEMEIDISAYDEVIIGTPVWAGKNAPALNTFLKNVSVRRKVSAVFTFSGGGDNDKCIAVLKKKLPNLKFQVAFADRNNELAKENDTKMNRFVEEILHG